MNQQHDIIDDRIDVVTRGFLGMSVSCARCHDHKYDPIPTADYYSLYGVFASSEEPAELPLAGRAPSVARVRGVPASKSSETTGGRQVARGTSLGNRKRTPLSGRRLSGLPRQDAAAVPARETAAAGQTWCVAIAAAVRRWQQYLANPADSPHPIWTLWHQLAALPASGFAEKSAAILERPRRRTVRARPWPEDNTGGENTATGNPARLEFRVACSMLC